MNLVIRADADTERGTGHVMRCLALTQTCIAQGGMVTFITDCEAAGLLDRITSLGAELVKLSHHYPARVDAETVERVISQQPGAWTVLDGYHFDIGYQRRLREYGHPVLVVDDLVHHGWYEADAILNQNVYAPELHYPCPPATDLLMGTSYALLRTEFAVYEDFSRSVPAVGKRVLITLGGGDPANQTLKALSAIETLHDPELEVICITGAANLHIDSIKAEARGATSHVSVIQDSLNMPELMAWADVAITAAGSTCWELAFMGLPAVLMVIADNQALIADGMAKAGAAVNIGWAADVAEKALAEELKRLLQDQGRRSAMSAQGRLLVDGQGTSRVLAAMVTSSASSAVVGLTGGKLQ
jgi:UDP-2,4-diacetamido-2,4,6-trideoxy-beta-L-altropyranose hydrolase